jgi:hypothetical protein
MRSKQGLLQEVQHAKAAVHKSESAVFEFDEWAVQKLFHVVQAYNMQEHCMALYRRQGSDRRTTRENEPSWRTPWKRFGIRDKVGRARVRFRQRLSYIFSTCAHGSRET